MELRWEISGFQPRSTWVAAVLCIGGGRTLLYLSLSAVGCQTRTDSEGNVKHCIQSLMIREEKGSVTDIRSISFKNLAHGNSKQIFLACCRLI